MIVKVPIILHDGYSTYYRKQIQTKFKVKIEPVVSSDHILTMN